MRLSFVRQCVQRENWGLKQKLDEAREKIVALMGDLPRVELFARQSPPGWEVWGNEVKSTIPDFGTKCPEVKGAGKEADPCPM